MRRLTPVEARFRKVTRVAKASSASNEVGVTCRKEVLLGDLRQKVDKVFRRKAYQVCGKFDGHSSGQSYFVSMALGRSSKIS